MHLRIIIDPYLFFRLFFIVNWDKNSARDLFWDPGLEFQVK